MNTHEKFTDRIYKFIENYTKMHVEGLVVNCPYWANKIKKGRVVLRGHLDGRGKADDIRLELIERIRKKTDANFQLTPEYIKKFAKRERLGVDCSGFAYRVMEELVRLKYANCNLSDLSEVFESGINRTNSNTLTSQDYCLRIDKISDIKLGDLLRMMNGKHIAVVLEVKNSQITYVHSSRLTETQGVHLGFIKIKDKDKSLEYQEWLERTRRGSNFGTKYSHEEKGDGVYRLKIFC